MSYSFYLTNSFKFLAALNPGTFDAGILIVSFVCGLIPVRAARVFTSNLPKPEISTRPPSFKVPDTVSNTKSIISAASFLVRLCFSATNSAMLFLFNVYAIFISS